MNEKMVLETAKRLNREKYILEKLNKQIETLKEKEDYLVKELESTSENLLKSKQTEEEIKNMNYKVKILANEESTKNQIGHSELLKLKNVKINLQKELNRVILENLQSKYTLDSLREQKKSLESTLGSLRETHSKISVEKEQLAQELNNAKNEYDELIQVYQNKRNEDMQLKSLYKFHFS
jgi:predicted HNH restriction endonuclease